MKVHELMDLLKDCNQEADVVIEMGTKSGRHSWMGISMDVIGLWGWPGDLRASCEINLQLEPSWDRSGYQDVRNE